MGKIFEKLVEKRLAAHSYSNNIIPNNQFGFRPSFSTTHQVHRMTKNIIHNRLNKKSTGVVLLDSEKAFDSIWHEGLVYKLIRFNFPRYLINIIQSFISNRQNNIHVANSTSNPYTPLAGVPQGSTLSPLLFNIYISDIPIMHNCEQYLYADDFALSSTAKNPKTIIKNLDIGLKKYARYCKKWKLKLNETKTEAIFFT